MTVIVLTACPPGLRGHLTQWLLEISAGVFVGHINRRIRDRLWQQVVALAGPGRALLVFQVRGEQRLSFKVHDHRWEPVDLDGVTLMRRPLAPGKGAARSPSGWSNASKRRRFGRRSASSSQRAAPESE
jgi:CRISPR-associated protein Cas2